MDYCRNDTDADLERLILGEVLTNLKRFDLRTLESKPYMAKARKRLVFGAIETRRQLELGKLKALIVARNLSLDSLFEEDFRFCIETTKSIPVLYCGKRKELGALLLNPRASVGIIGILKVDGVEQAWNEAIELWSKLSQNWLERSSQDIENLWTCSFFGHIDLLHAIYAKGSIDILRQYVNVGKLEYQGKTLLLIATERDNVEVMEFLIQELHADENIPDFALNLPIHVVKSANAAKLLKFNQRCNAAGKNVIELAAENGRIEVLEYFYSMHNDFIDISKLLFAAVRCKKSSSIEFVTKKLKISNYGTFTNDKGNDLIMEAVESGSYEVFKKLIGQNYPINYELKNNCGEGILEIANRIGNQGISRYLTKHAFK